MFEIFSEDSVVVYDEIGWGDTVFSNSEILKDIITNQINHIKRISFLNIDRVIIIELDIGSFYWFKNIDYYSLNLLCQMSELYTPVKKFFMAGSYLSFSVDKFQKLAAVILGNNIDTNH